MCEFHKFAWNSWIFLSKLLFELGCLCVCFHGSVCGSVCPKNQSKNVAIKSCHIRRIKIAVLFWIFLEQICPNWIKLGQIGITCHQSTIETLLHRQTNQQNMQPIATIDISIDHFLCLNIIWCHFISIKRGKLEGFFQNSLKLQYKASIYLKNIFI